MFKKLQLKIYRSCFPKLTFVIITFFLSFRFLIIYVIVVGIVSLNCKIGEFVCNNDYIRRQKEAKSTLPKERDWEQRKRRTRGREKLGNQFSWSQRLPSQQNKMAAEVAVQISCWMMNRMLQEAASCRTRNCPLYHRKCLLSFIFRTHRAIWSSLS